MIYWWEHLLQGSGKKPLTDSLKKQTIQECFSSTVKLLKISFQIGNKSFIAAASLDPAYSSSISQY